ncbi:MAG: fatty acid desaturase CarF family protein [Gemmatimonas sp.]
MLSPNEVEQEAPAALRRVQFVGYIALFALLALLGRDLLRGFDGVGNPWTAAAAVLAGYLVADLLSGVVHFLADNFGSPETPFLGQGFVLPFRQHHVDPLGITRHGFFNANGNNALVCLPVLVPVVLFVPVTTSAVGYVAGVFSFVMLFAVFLTNQTHKWAHMETVPRPVRWMQDAGLILSKSHHSIHHERPYNTHYCITVGAWNAMFERFRVFDRVERAIRQWVPGTDPRTRVDQDASVSPPAQQAD